MCRARPDAMELVACIAVLFADGTVSVLVQIQCMPWHVITRRRAAFLFSAPRGLNPERRDDGRRSLGSQINEQIM
jgi:hypothetical protein